MSQSGAQSPRTDVDKLFEVRTYYYIGAYQQCLNTINKMPKSDSTEQACFMWRAYLGQGKFRVVLDGISRDETAAGDALTAVRQLADYLANPGRRPAIVQWFDGKLADWAADKDADPVDRAVCCTSAGTVYYNEGLFESALKVLHGRPELECLAMAVQTLLRMNRTDVARKVLARMQERDDDATLTQLALAWLNIEVGGEKLQDAYYIFQDFADKFVPTNVLLNGQAVCYMGQHKYEEAGQALRESLDRDPNDYDTLVNSIAMAEHLPGDGGAGAGSSNAATAAAESIQRYLSQIKDSHASSQLVADLEKREAEFDRLCQKYEPTVKQTPVLA